MPIKLTKCFNKLVEHIYVLQSNVVLEAGKDVIRYDVSGRCIYVNDIFCVKFVAYAGSSKMRDSVPVCIEPKMPVSLRIKLMRRLMKEFETRRER